MKIVEEWKDDEILFNVAEEAKEHEKDAGRGPKPTKSLNDYDKEYQEILDQMMQRKEIDKLNMEKELSSLGKCHKYKPTLNCVKGKNL